MSIGTNVLTILQQVQALTQQVQALTQQGQASAAEAKRLDGLITNGFAAVNGRLDDVDLSLDNIELQIGQPETGSFNPNPKDPTMSVLQMTIGDAPHSSALTFSEPGAPADGAVASDNAAVATIALAADLITWTITLAPGGAPGVCNMTYTGTSTPPDVGPVVVEPLVLTVIALPAAETGQFNP